MTREAGGSPFVLEQLARYAGVDRTASDHAPTFASDVRRRGSVRSRRMRAASSRRWRSAAGRWRPSSSATRAGSRATRQSLVAMLRSSHFIRSSGSSERVETYHDRIREVLAAQIAPDAVRRIHGLMVQALVERRSDDCEALFEHYRGAGDHEQRVDSGRSCRRESGHRARLRSGRVLLPAGAGADARRRLPPRHGGKDSPNALANAGRPAEAAEAYLDAAAGAGHAQRVELQRRAAEQFLIGGHIDRGLDLIRSVLAGIGHACRLEARAPRCCRCCGDARGFGGAGCASFRRRVDDIDADDTPSRGHLLVGGDGIGAWWT